MAKVIPPLPTREEKKGLQLWLREFRKSAVLVLSEEIAQMFCGEDLFVPNWKYFDTPGIKMINGELGYLFIHPRFVRIVQKSSLPIKQ